MRLDGGPGNTKRDDGSKVKRRNKRRKSWLRGDEDPTLRGNKSSTGFRDATESRNKERRMHSWLH